MILEVTRIVYFFLPLSLAPAPFLAVPRTSLPRFLRCLPVIYRQSQPFTPSAIHRPGKRTLLSASPLLLCCHADTDKSVVRLELLHRCLRVVDERETGALATTELGAETEDGNGLLVALVELGELGAEVFLGDIGALRVEDVTVGGDVLEYNLVEFLFAKVLHCVLCVSRAIFLVGDLEMSGDVHDHLLASEQWVTDELAGAESDFGHGCDGIVEK